MAVSMYNQCCILLAWSLVFVSSNTSANLDQLFEVGNEVSNLRGKSTFIALVGGSGTGKSTLSKFLRRDPNLQVIENEGSDFVFSDKEDRIGNENPLESKTLFPHVDVDNKTGELLVDLAGFKDTRHATYELLASFFNKKILDTAVGIKIILIENFERLRLGSERNAFETTIRNLEEMLPEDLEPFRESLALIATKVDVEKKDVRAKRVVLAFLKKSISTLETKMNEAELKNENNTASHFLRMITLLNFVNDGEKIAFFHRPEMAGNPFDQSALMQDWEAMRTLVFGLAKYSALNKAQYQVSVTADTKIYIEDKLLSPGEETLRDTLASLWTSASKTMASKRTLRDNVDLLTSLEANIVYYKQLKEEFSNASNFDDLLRFATLFGATDKEISATQLQLKKVEFYLSVVMEDSPGVTGYFNNSRGMVANAISNELKIYDFLHKLLRDAQTYDFVVEIMHSENKIFHVDANNFDEFIHSLPKTSEFTLGKSIKLDGSELQQINKVISATVANTLSVEKNSTSTVISGKYLVLSMLSENIATCKGQLVLMAEHKVFLDRNLDLIDTHLAIAAPVIQVVANRTLQVTLKGSKGYEYEKPSSIAGGKGGSGGNGFSSGDLTITALEVVNAKNLAFLSLGGDGGRGQQGGAGINGVVSSLPYLNEGHWGSEYDVSRRGIMYGYENSIGYSHYESGESLEAVFYAERTTYKNFKVTITNRQGTRSPTNGGDGGDGGTGAPPGDVNVLVEKNKIATSSEDGKKGRGGEGGKGGQSMPACARRIYNCRGREKIKYYPFHRDVEEFRFDCYSSDWFYCSYTSGWARNGNQGKDGSALARSKASKIWPTFNATQIAGRYKTYVSKTPYTMQLITEFQQYISRI